MANRRRRRAGGGGITAIGTHRVGIAVRMRGTRYVSVRIARRAPSVCVIALRGDGA